MVAVCTVYTRALERILKAIVASNKASLASNTGTRACRGTHQTNHKHTRTYTRTRLAFHILYTCIYVHYAVFIKRREDKALPFPVPAARMALPRHFPIISEETNRLTFSFQELRSAAADRQSPRTATSYSATALLATRRGSTSTSNRDTQIEIRHLF